MLHFSRDSDDGARSHLLWLFAPFLIPAATSDADQYLHLLMMDVPVVAAARFEGNINQTVLHRSQIAVADEILGIARVETLALTI